MLPLCQGLCRKRRGDGPYRDGITERQWMRMMLGECPFRCKAYEERKAIEERAQTRARNKARPRAQASEQGARKKAFPLGVTAILKLSTLRGGRQ